MIVDLCEIVSGFVCLTGKIYQQNTAMPQEDMHVGSGKKCLLLESTVTGLEYQLGIAQGFPLHSVLGVWLAGTQHGGNRQKHAAGSSLGPVDQMVTASSVPCRCLASDDILAGFLFFEGGNCEFVNF